MAVILPSVTLLIGLVFGAWQGFDVGKGRGRAAERRQVLAFLVAMLNDTDAHPPEELAKAIDRGDHLAWDLRQR